MPAVRKDHLAGSSKPPPLSIPPPPPPLPAPVKRTTVDVINSKISYGTAIPVDFVESADDFKSKWKRYDIIDGKNPFDDDDAASKAAAAAASIVKTEPNQDDKGSDRSKKRRRTLSPPLTGRRGGAAIKPVGVKREEEAGSDQVSGGGEWSLRTAAAPIDAEHFVSDVSASPLLARVEQMPVIPGWAASRLGETTPYQVQTSKDAETRIKYILDDYDYEWCATHDVSPEVLQRSFTFFEWTYVSFLLNAAQGDDGLSSTFSSAALMTLQSGGGGGSASRGDRATTTTSGRATTAAMIAQGTAASANAAAAAAGMNANLRNFLVQAKRLNSCLCAVCAKPVHVITTSDKARLSELQATESLGVKCGDCDTIAHLRCWYLPVPPQRRERWVCDGCYLYSQNRRRLAFARCVICGRADGALFAYRARDAQGGTAAAVAEGGGGTHATTPTAGSARSRGTSDAVTTLKSPTSASSSSGTTESGLCHAVCALAFPELAIRVPGAIHLDDFYTYVDSSRTEDCAIDLGLRPCVVPARRIPKQVSHCIYCQQASYPTVQCNHPRCYEAIHPSCAAEQHTVECFALDDTTAGRNSGGSSSSSGSAGGGDKLLTMDRTTSTDGGGKLGDGGTSVLTWEKTRATDSAASDCATTRRGGRRTSANEEKDTATATAAPEDDRAVTVGVASPWTGCSVYCRKHFGYNINRTLGSAAVAEKAEAQALKMDLHAVLSGLPMTYRQSSTVASDDSEGPDNAAEANPITCGSRRGRAGARSTPATRGRTAVASASSSGGSTTTTNEAFFLEGSMPVSKAVRRGPGRPSAAELQRRSAERLVVANVRKYWLQKRAGQRRHSAALAGEINISHRQPILAAALRPELIKISASRVRLSHFLCLIPEWQQMLVVLVEGELPLPDEEYDDVQRYRKASAHTRRSGNTAELFQRMAAAQTNLTTFMGCAALVKQQAAARMRQVVTELKWCDALTEWKGVTE